MLVILLDEFRFHELPSLLELGCIALSLSLNDDDLVDLLICIAFVFYKF